MHVVLNNAGIGCCAAIEEGDAAEVRRMFEVKVCGTGMVQAVLAAPPLQAMWHPCGCPAGGNGRTLLRLNADAPLSVTARSRRPAPPPPHRPQTLRT